MNNKHFFRNFAIKAAVILSAAALTACSGSKKNDDMSGDYGDAETSAINVFAGMIVSSEDMNIEKREGYTISEIKVSVGDHVEPGDVLFEYDIEEASLNLQKSKLEYEQMELSLEQMKENKAELEREKAYASESQQLSYSLEIQSLEADILEAKYNLNLKADEIKVQENATLENVIRSEIAGTVKSINKNGGYDNMGNELPFMVISGSGSYQVLGHVNEANISQLYEGMEVTVLSRVDDSSWRGTISRVDLENPVQNQNNYYGNSMNTSSKYPFYVELEESEGLLLGQHVYIDPGIELWSGNYGGGDIGMDDMGGDIAVPETFAE